MLRQDETDKPLIAIWIPEATEWSMLVSNTEEEEGWGGSGRRASTHILLHTEDWKKTTSI